MHSLSVWKEWAHESVLSVEAREGVALPEMQLEAAGSLPVWMGSGNWPPGLYKSNARSWLLSNLSEPRSFCFHVTKGRKGLFTRGTVESSLYWSLTDQVYVNPPFPNASGFNHKHAQLYTGPRWKIEDCLHKFTWEHSLPYWKTCLGWTDLSILIGLNRLQV